MLKKKRIVRAEIKRVEELLEQLEPGSEEQIMALQYLTDLEELRTSKLKKHMVWIEPVLKVGGPIAIAVLGYKYYDKWYKIGLEFEKTNVVTSPQTKTLMSGMFPRIKG